jgi:trans-aconitate methyltransferase
MIGRALKDHTNSEFKDRIAFRVGSVENEAQFKHKKYDVVYSNAALHWCTSHAQLFPDLIHSMVNPTGGVLAVQMPDTIDQTSHVLMDTAAFRSGMLDKIRHVRIPRTEHDATW